MVCSTAVYDGTEHGEEEEGGDINLDARVLSVQRTAGGERRRNFKDAVEELVRTPHATVASYIVKVVPSGVVAVRLEESIAAPNDTGVAPATSDRAKSARFGCQI